MPLTKLTTEIYEKLRVTMGLSHQQIRDQINSGKIPGRKLNPEDPDGRIYLIDDSFIPKDKSEEPVPTKIEVPEDTQKTLQDMDSKIVIAKKQIELDEINKVRDLPEVLKKKEAGLKELEAKLNERKLELDNKELTLNQREADISVEESTTNQLRLEFDQYQESETASLKARLSDIQKGHDLLIAERQLKLDDIKSQIVLNEAKLDGLLDVISQYPDVILPFIETLRQYKKLCDGLASREYNRAEKTKGPISDRHTQLAEHGWDIGKGLSKIAKWLNGG